MYAFTPRCAAAAMLVVSAAVGSAEAADPGVDAVFVGNVSQGGRYEVAASVLAQRRATGVDIKDLATAEVHDHELVNAQLKKIADGAGIKIEPNLNAIFQQRLEILRKASAAEFDQAYVDDMKQIHDKDEKLFAKEAGEGSASFQPFAHQTDLVVKRHIGALHGTD